MKLKKKEYIFHFNGMKDYSSFQDSKRGKRTQEYDFQGIEYELKKTDIPYCADLTL